MCTWTTVNLKDLDREEVTKLKTGLLGSFYGIHGYINTNRDTDLTVFHTQEGSDGLVCIINRYLGEDDDGNKISSYPTVIWGAAIYDADPATLSQIIKKLYEIGNRSSTEELAEAQSIYELYTRYSSGQELTDDDLVALWLHDKGENGWRNALTNAVSDRIGEMQMRRDRQADIARLIEQYGADKVLRMSSANGAINNSQQLIKAGASFDALIRKALPRANSRGRLREFTDIGLDPQDTIRVYAIATSQRFPSQYIDRLDKVALEFGVDIAPKVLEEFLLDCEKSVWIDDDPAQCIKEWVDKGISPESIADKLHLLNFRDPHARASRAAIRDEKVFQVLLEGGLDVNFLVDRIDSMGDLLEHLDFLLKNGADADYVADKIAFPIVILRYIDVLRRAGATIDANQLAADIPPEHRARLLGRLRQAGADIAITDFLDELDAIGVLWAIPEIEAAGLDKNQIVAKKFTDKDYRCYADRLLEAGIDPNLILSHVGSLATGVS